MSKITIKDIENAIKLLNIDEIGSNQDSDNGDFERNINNKLEIEFAIKKLCSRDQQIIQMIIGGFSYKEIECEINVSSKTIRKALLSLGDMIK